MDITKVLICIFLFPIILGGVMDAGASQKNALIIGNSSYAFSPLKNPYNDAKDFSKVLTELGYNTICLTNGSKNQMLNAVRSFETRLKRDGGIGLFYYAGHAVQFDDQNYLIPIDAKLEDTVSLSIHTIKLQTVLRLFETAGNETNIIILDACRNNPFNGYVQNKDGILTRSVGRSISVVPSKGITEARSSTWRKYNKKTNLMEERVDDTGWTQCN